MLGEQPHTVSRFAPGTRDEDGEFIPGVESQIIVRGSLQPLSSNEVQLLEGGERARARWTFFTKGTLQMSDRATQTLGDEFHHPTGRLVVVGVDDWSAQRPGSRTAHREYFLALKEV